MTESSRWTPYPHDGLRVRLLWRKRLILGLILGIIFALWALSLNVTTETEQQLTVYGGDGSSVTVNKPEEREVQPAAQVTLRPGETARLQDDLQLNDRQRETSAPPPQLPEQPPGVPWAGVLLVLGPFALAVLLWRYLGNRGASTEVNYGIYKGAMPLELVTASHAHLVQTGKPTDQNPFGKMRSDYLSDAGAEEETGRPRQPVTVQQR